MDAEPVLMPAVRSWVRQQVVENGNSTEDICIVMVCNCPTAGILTSLQKSFITNFVTNLVADFPLNACCLLVHPNRAGQSEGRTRVEGCLVIKPGLFTKQIVKPNMLRLE